METFIELIKYLCYGILILIVMIAATLLLTSFVIRIVRGGRDNMPEIKGTINAHDTGYDEGYEKGFTDGQNVILKAVKEEHPARTPTQKLRIFSSKKDSDV